MYFSLLDFHLDKDKVFLKKNIAFNKTFISLPLDEGMFSFHIIHWDKSVIGAQFENLGELVKNTIFVA